MNNSGVIFCIMAAFAASHIHSAENPVVNKIISALKELESLPAPNTNEDFAKRISLLGTNLTQSEPDSPLLMEGLSEYMTTSESAPHLVRMLWPSIATPQERARFLVTKIGQTQQNQIGFVAALVERELVDQQTVIQYPESVDAIGLGREVLFSGNAFIPVIQSSGGVNPQLAAIWFSKAPYQAALACLGANDENKKLKLLFVNNLRFEIEQDKSNDQKEQSWHKLDHELALMLSSGSPVFEMYAAGVLKWRRTVEASLSESDALRTAINRCSNPIVTCILQGITTETLTSLPSNKVILVSTPNPIVAPTAITAQPTPPLPMATPPPQEQVASSSPPTMEETKPAPWPWIIGAILLLAVFGGVWWKCLRK